MSRTLFIVGNLLILFVFWSQGTIILFLVFLMVFIIINYYLIKFQVKTKYHKPSIKYIKNKNKANQIEKIKFWLFVKTNSILNNSFIIFFNISLFFHSLWSIYYEKNYFIIIFFLIILFLTVITSKNWANLQIKINLIYFMKLFLQENKLYKNLIEDYSVRDFVLNLKYGLWWEVKNDFNHFLQDLKKNLIYGTLRQTFLALRNIHSLLILVSDFTFNGKIEKEELEDGNKIRNFGYESHFKYFDSLLNCQEILDDWIFKIFMENNFSKFDKKLKSIYAKIRNIYLEKNYNESFTRLEFCRWLSENKEIKIEYEDQNQQNSPFVNIDYYFKSYYKGIFKLNEWIERLEKDLQLESNDDFEERREKKRFKILKDEKMIKNITTKIEQLNREELGDFLNKNLREDFEAILDNYEYYRRGKISNRIFVEKSLEDLGKKFVKIWKK